MAFVSRQKKTRRKKDEVYLKDREEKKKKGRTMVVFLATIVTQEIHRVALDDVFWVKLHKLLCRIP